MWLSWQVPQLFFGRKYRMVIYDACVRDTRQSPFDMRVKMVKEVTAIDVFLLKHELSYTFRTSGYTSDVPFQAMYYLP